MALNNRAQAIAGIVPPDVSEAVIMQVWPSISASALGRSLGLLYQVPLVLRVPVVLATLPLVLILYFMPRHRLRRYTLTTRRVIIDQGARARVVQDLPLDEITEIRVVVRPGQTFFRTGDLHLMCGERVGMVLRGVQCPETFRRNILMARDAYVKIMEVHRALQESGSAQASAKAKGSSEPAQSEAASA